MDTLGERIRRLRKERKLTLQELAGDKMSKGMLSLIENNKAKPSMESLSFIASQLGVPSSELLAEVGGQQLRELLEQAEEYASVRFLDEGADEARKNLVKLIGPYLDKLGDGYESGRLLELYGSSLHWTGGEEWQEPMRRAADIYDALNIVPRRAAISMFRAQVRFNLRDYAGSLEVLLSERRALEDTGLFIEPMTRLDFDYLEAALLYAVGRTEEAVGVMERALAFSREKDLYYRISDWYRLASIHALMSGLSDDYALYKNKLRLYTEFAEDEETKGFLLFLDVHELNSFRHDYEEAIRQIQNWPDHSGGTVPNPFHSPYLDLEKGKALSGLGRHDEAIDVLEKVLVPHEYVHHPIDLSIFMEGEAFKAESLYAAGRKDEAEQLIRDVKKRIHSLPPTPYKARVEHAYLRMTDS